MTTYYRFDRFELRPARRQLLEDGVEIDVGGRAFDLLVALVERRDQIVTRDALYALVWPSVSVELNNLHVQIWRLRSRLGVHTIRTIARQGYQFVADVEAIESPASSTRVPAWFAPPDRDESPVRHAPQACAGSRLEGALRRHRLVAFVHQDDAQRRRLFDAALASLPPARRRGTLRYDTTDLLRRTPAASAHPSVATQSDPVHRLLRAASRASAREQLFVLQDAHVAPAVVASVVDAVLRRSAHTRFVLGACAPLGLPDEHVLLADAADRDPGVGPDPGADDAAPSRAGPSGLLHAESPVTEPARPLRWRPRGTAA